MRRYVLAGLLSVLACSGVGEAAAQIQPVPGLGDTANLVLALRRAGFTGSVLQITAHPDDENHGALTYLSRCLGARVGLLTLTHGGAFGNALDDRVGVALGVLRTQELLAADQYYGIDQFFTRATDSGTVKDGPTALRLWGHDAVLGDVVRIIRFYRPDVIVARWQGNERDGHGHHMAAGLLAREAFHAAADSTHFPEHLTEGLAPWQAKKLYINWLTADQEATVEIDAGEYDPVLGSSYAELGVRGLSLQRSQVQRVHAWPGSAVYRFQLIESKLRDQGKEVSLFDGIETSLPGLSTLAGNEEHRVPWLRQSLEEADGHWKAALASFRPDAPHEIASHLFAALKLLQELSRRTANSTLSLSRRDAVLFRLRHKVVDFEDAAARSLGLRLEAFVDPFVQPRKTLVPGVGGWPPSPEFVVPGQTFTVTVALWNRSPWTVQVEGCDLEAESGWTFELVKGSRSEIGYNQGASYQYSIRVPEDAAYSQPNWERPSYHKQLNRFVEPAFRLSPRRLPALVGKCRYRAFDLESSVSIPVKVRTYDQLHGEQEQELKVVPRVVVEVRPQQQIIPLKSSRQELSVQVTLQSHFRGSLAGELRIEVPPSWDTPSPRTFQFRSESEEREYRFTIQLPEMMEPGIWKIRAVAQVNEEEYRVGYDRIAYPHMDPEHLYKPAQMLLAVVDAEVANGVKVGYVSGRGGDRLVPKVLAELGVETRILEATEFTLQHLKEFHTVVLGPFAFAVHPKLRAAIPELTQYVEQGGVVVALPYAVVGPIIPYPIEPREGAAGWGPFRYRLPGNVFRGVVDPQVSVRFLSPEHPVLNIPNKISTRDFTNWISALAVGIPKEWDSQYEPLLSLEELDGRETQGSLLVASYGRGLLVYTGLPLHLQLHAAIPGAVRLLANLVSLRSDAVHSAP